MFATAPAVGQKTNHAHAQQREGGRLGDLLAPYFSSTQSGKASDIGAVVEERSLVDLSRKGDGDRIADDQAGRQALSKYGS